MIFTNEAFVNADDRYFFAVGIRTELRKRKNASGQFVTTFIHFECGHVSIRVHVCNLTPVCCRVHFEYPIDDFGGHTHPYFIENKAAPFMTLAGDLRSIERG